VGTPPRVLTAQHAAYSDSEGEEEEQLYRQYTALNNDINSKLAPHLTGASAQATPDRQPRSLSRLLAITND